MNKEEQILRIKELINESTLYGKLVDEEILNETSTTKKAVKSASDLITTFIKFSSDELDSQKVKRLIDAVQTKIDTLNASVNKETIDNLLDADNPENVYDQISNILKTQLKTFKQGAGLASPSYLTTQVGDQIDTLVNNMKKLDLDLYRKPFDELPEKTRNILDTIPNIRAQYILNRPIKYVLSDKFLSLVKSSAKTLFKPFRFRENASKAWSTFIDAFNKDDEGKRQLFTKLFKAHFELVGGELKPFVAWWGIAIGKDIARALLFCSKYEKSVVNLPTTKKKIDQVKKNINQVKKNINQSPKTKTEHYDKYNKVLSENIVVVEKKVNEQEVGEEKSIAEQQKDDILGVGNFLLHVASPKFYFDPFTAFSEILQKFNIDAMKGSGLLGEQSWSCPTREDHEAMIKSAGDVLEKNGISRELLNEKVQEGQDSLINYFNTNAKKVGELVGVDIEQNKLTQEEVIKALENLNQLDGN
jgi:hypothetical protein